MAVEALRQIKQSAEFIKGRGILAPRVGIILGSGLGGMVDHIAADCILEYQDIPFFPVSTVESHKGRLIYGQVGETKVLAMQGRFHLYEGYDLQRITFPIRVMKMLGVKYLLISNAAGSMNPDMHKGELMMIEDHINLQGGSPLTGPNLEELGPRYPDMSQPYSPALRQRLRQFAKEGNVCLHEGVYVAVAGPHFETRAEYRFLRALGADVVGMSTVPEVIVARHMNMEVAAISVVTDECDPDNLVPLEWDDVLAIATQAQEGLTEIYLNLVKELA